MHISLHEVPSRNKHSKCDPEHQTHISMPGSLSVFHVCGVLPSFRLVEVHVSQRGPEWELEPLELEVQTVVSLHVGAGN